jgi:hypothetical protein
MLCYLGAWIKTEKGTLRVMPEETSKGLGASKNQRTILTSSILKNTTSLFHWEYLSMSLTLLSFDNEDMIDTEPTDGSRPFSSDTEDFGEDTGTTPVFHWKPPDLSEGNALGS